ncbi:carbamoyltransferase [Nonomuraea sp. NPDC049714]|uniref:carbamoyltransferase n=1 Tax=Nonomuraea sp. NPDC049714 TaxID=3364357 RepID=UPI0037B51DC4
MLPSDVVYVLGISAFFHDSAACLVRDGEIVAAAEEERFSRIKHDAGFPRAAVAYCLRAAEIEMADVDLVVFYEKPLLKFQRLFATYLEHAPRGYRQFRLSAARWLGRRLRIRRELDRGLGHGYRGRYYFTEHHESHAASAFFPSPFDDAAIVTLDAVGEWATTSIAHGREGRVEMLRELRFPHSLGLLYSAMTAFTGFRVNSGEYKLMGLAPYGEPIHRDTILRELIELRDDGSFRLNMRYFAFDRADVMTSPAFDRLFGGPPRHESAPITRREMDLAASVQSVTEEVVLRITRHARELTGSPDLVLAGGVALNCVANGHLLRSGVFDRIWVQPAAGDSGAALGCALFAWHHLLDNPRPATTSDAMRGCFLGPRFGNDEIRRYLESVGARFHVKPDEGALCTRVAELIADGKIVAHFAGRMEFGPRALGNRSILADAREPDMQRTLNLRIKFRESFRPFAPAVLRERVHEYFVWAEGMDSPYMGFVTDVRSPQELPAITHVDGSARIQTVDPDRHPRLHGILRAFERRTGCPLIINTSLNVRGEPIVHTPAEAYHCLMSTGIDVLILENTLVYFEEQPAANRRATKVAAD